MNKNFNNLLNALNLFGLTMVCGFLKKIQKEIIFFLNKKVNILFFHFFFYRTFITVYKLQKEKKLNKCLVIYCRSTNNKIIRKSNFVIDNYYTVILLNIVFKH